MHLVKDNQFILVAGEIGFRISELGAIRTALKIEVYGRACIANFLREGGLADLTRPEQGNGRGVADRFNQALPSGKAEVPGKPLSLSSARLFLRRRPGHSHAQMYRDQARESGVSFRSDRTKTSDTRTS